MAIESEAELSAKLKTLCAPYGDKWKEKHPKKSAKIFHQLGINYRDRTFNENQNRLDEKINFIQSAALLNGALVRAPAESNFIKKDLQQLCSKILFSTGAKNKDFDLVHFADNLKHSIEKWRNEVKEQTQTLLPIQEQNESKLMQTEHQTIHEVESLQNQITEKYKHFMQSVSQVSIEILGEKPCNFTLVGMGSLARNEITPYSDFENIILMQEGVQNDKKSYEKMLEYFRWYAVIFQIILINLGETILPNVAIPSLNDFNDENGNWFFDSCTKRGISFDGMMPHACKSPLGRQPTKEKPWEIELIKPVSLMAKYLTQEQNLKNGYHLADILTNTCFVAGSQDVYEKFEKEVENILKEENSSSKQEIIEMIKDDMQKYSTKLSISATIENDSYNVKQFAYRSTTIFISAIAKLHNIKPGSCFEVVRRMREKDLVSEAFSHKLQYAVALACEIRLKTYLEQGYQYDYVESSVEEDAEDVSMSLINAVGKKRCYDYLEIACCLQYDTISFFKLDSKYMFFHPVGMSIAISALLRLQDHIIAAKDYIQVYPILQDQPTPDENPFIMEDIDDAFRSNDYLGSNYNLFLSDAIQHSKTIDTKRSVNNMPFGRWYLEIQRFNERLTEFYSFAISSSQPKCPETNPDCIISIIFDTGKYFFEKGVYFEAQYCFSTALKGFKEKIDAAKSSRPNCLFWIAMCLSKNKEYISANKMFSKTLQLYESLSDGQKNIKNFEADCFKEMGICQQKLDLHDKAVESFETALNYYNSSKPRNLKSIGFCLLNMGFYLYGLNKFKDALKKFKRLKNIYANCNDATDISKADCLYHLGRCYRNLNQFKEGKNAILKAIEIYREDMEKIERSEVYKARTLYRIGKSFNEIDNKEKAIESYLNSLQLWEKLLNSYPNDNELLLKIAISHKLIGRCYSKYNFNKKAIEHYEKSLELFQVLKHDKDVGMITCKLYRFIGKTHRELENYEEAYKYFSKGISESSETTPVQLLAGLNRNCGVCLKRLNKTDEAARHTNIALKIYWKLYEKENSGNVLRGIGLCYKNLDSSLSDSKKYLCKYIESFTESEQLLSLNDRSDIAKVLQTLGLIYRTERNWDSALDYFRQSLDVLKKLPESLEFVPEIAWLHNRIGEYWLLRYREKTAETSFQNAIALSDYLSLTSKGSYMLAVSYKNLGRTCLQQQLFNKASKNFQKAERLLSALPNRSKHFTSIAWLFKKIGMCFKEQNWHSKAIANLQKAMDVCKEMPRVDNYLKEVAYILNNMGLCYQSLQHSAKALEKLQRSLIIYNKLAGCELYVAFVLTRIGICYEALSRNRKANIFFKLAIKAFKKLPNCDQFRENINFLVNKLDTRQYKRAPGNNRSRRSKKVQAW